MNATVFTAGGVRWDSLADRALNASARFWFLVAVLGQIVFACYIVAFYGGAIARGDIEAWNRVLPSGYMKGDTMGNLALGAHLLMAAILTLGGPLQLVPQIRSHALAFHRWNGRIYLSTAVIASIAGLYLVWARPSIGSVVQHLGISFNAVLIMLCAAMAVRHAIARDLRTHRRWALRLFMAVSGVWFFRVGLMFWVVLNQGPAGFDPKTFQGPFLDVWAFACYLLPLAVLELYLGAQDRAGARGRLAMAGALVALTVAMGIGVFTASIGMWLPRVA